MFEYPCPGCGATNILHSMDCSFEYVEPNVFRKAYIDILSVLIEVEVRRQIIAPAEYEFTFTDLRDEVNDSEYMAWDELHTACLHSLKRRGAVVESDDGNLRHIAPPQRENVREPNVDLLRLVYEYGACDGCLDYGTCAMVSWCEMQEYTWSETKQFVCEWLETTGTWERGSFEEATPEAMVETKRHVYDNGVGWKKFAQSTVTAMHNRGHIPDDEVPER